MKHLIGLSRLKFLNKLLSFKHHIIFLTDDERIIINSCLRNGYYNDKERDRFNSIIHYFKEKVNKNNHPFQRDIETHFKCYMKDIQNE